MGVLRVILALSVVVGHAGPLLGYRLFESAAAVQCFYVISGFYMALVLDKSYAGGLRRFYLSRYLRLAPTYWVVMLGSVVAALVFHRTPALNGDALSALLHRSSTGTLAVLAFVNLFIVGQDLVMFLAIDSDGHLYPTAAFGREAHPAFTLLLVEQAWSLGVELAFYALAPFLLRRRTSLIVAVAIASVGIRVMLWERGYSHDPWSYRFFPSELGVFLFGSIAYRAYRRGILVASSKHARVILGLAIAVLLGYSLLPVGIPEPAKRFGAVVMLALALPSLFALTKNSARDTYIGRLSYPIYISHVLLLGIARYAGRYRSFALVVLSVFTAILLVHFVEDVVDRWRVRLRGGPRPTG